jgi:hypothetical protein
MKNSESLTLDGKDGAVEESESIDAPAADELPLSDWLRELLERRLDAFERDRNPGRLASVVVDEIRHRRGLGSEGLQTTTPADVAHRRLVLCLENSGYEASLERNAIYVAIPDQEAEIRGLVRVIDETGEDYVYPRGIFMRLRRRSLSPEALSLAMMPPHGNMSPVTTADHIYDEVRTLPDSQAREVLDFVTRLKANRRADQEERRKAALSTLAKYRGRFEAVKFNRDELYDREGLR